IYMDNCVFQSNIGAVGPLNMMQYLSTNNTTDGGVWGGACVNSLTAGSGVGLGTLARDWGFAVGVSIYGAGTSDTFDHHVYPQVQTHSLYRYLAFGPGPLRNYCINTNYDQQGVSLEYAEFVLMSDNDFTGTHRAHDASNGSNDPSTSRFRNMVVQQ